MPNAQLSEQRVDRADLDACSAARVAEISGCDMVFAVGLQQGKVSGQLTPSSIVWPERGCYVSM